MNNQDEDKYLLFKIKQFNKYIIKRVVLPYSITASIIIGIMIYTNITGASQLTQWYYLVIACILPTIIIIYSSIMIAHDVSQYTFNFMMKLEKEFLNNDTSRS